MSSKKKVFIGVAWPYVNGDIHIGHLAGYLLPADIFARFHRYIGNDVLMVSGSDCFGTPITLEADKRKISPQKIVNEYHEKNVKLFKKLGISYDLYTKTQTENHKEIVQDLFLRSLEKGYVFKGISEQYYSAEDKKFLPDRYVSGACPNCKYEDARGDQCDNCGIVLSVGELKNPKNRFNNKPLTIKETEHYFFNWQKSESFLKKYVNSHKKNWRKWVLNETEGWLKKGLKPRAITRDLDWGVEIPVNKIPKNLQIEGAEHKRIYVWFEAVIGYLSASVEWGARNKKSWKEFWFDPAVAGKLTHAYFMGKDNLIFHTLFWPGELRAYNEKIHLPDSLLINQFLNLDGQKFSKSRGLTIDSEYFADTYGLDTLRFYLALISPEHADTNFSWSDFVSRNNNVLIGNFGNFINRTLTLAKRVNFEGLEIDKKITKEVSKWIDSAKDYLEKGEFKNYAESILALSAFGNKYLGKKEPWFLKEKDPKAFGEVMLNSMFIVLGLLLLIRPLIPNTAENLSSMLGIKISKWDKSPLDEFGRLVLEIKIGKIEPIFNKLDEEIIKKETAKIKPR